MVWNRSLGPIEGNVMVTFHLGPGPTFTMGYGGQACLRAEVERARSPGAAARVGDVARIGQRFSRQQSAFDVGGADHEFIFSARFPSLR